MLKDQHKQNVNPKVKGDLATKCFLTFLADILLNCSYNPKYSYTKIKDNTICSNVFI